LQNKVKRFILIIQLFLIQFLNIAGVGPIFGAIMGILYGPSAYLWIVLGSIFGGAVHDYLSGMISIRKGVARLTQIVGDELGKSVKVIMTIFIMLLMVLVGTVFVKSPTSILDSLTPNISDATFWAIAIFIYYILATILPIDKIIGKFYPIFGGSILFMAVGILIALFANDAPILEITDGLHNRQSADMPIFPMMFISIACGAISGFHATQSPMMARCIKNEKYGKCVFYGAMIAEGIVALIWAAAASSFFGSVEGLQNFLANNSNNAAAVVNEISIGWLGKFGGILAIIGVVAAPITSGDTALRSARLIVADAFNFEQKSIVSRLLVAVPIFLLTFALYFINFDIIWRYFSWSNQTLAAFTFWAATIYMARNRKNFIITLIPGIFITFICSCFICYSPIGFRFPINISYIISAIFTIALLVLFIYWYHNNKRQRVI
jgi:carbon starvation protein CstA